MGVFSKFFKILCNILSGIVGIILIVTLYAWMQVNIFHMDYANVFGYSIFNVVTGSMSGTIEIDDYVVVRVTKDIKLNDIITYKDGNTLVTHRVVEIVGNRLITKGDANNTDDNSISLSDVVGKVVMVIPKAGIWKNVLMEPKVLVTILITLILFTIFFSFEEKKYIKKTQTADMSALNNLKIEEKGKKKTVKKANLDELKKLS